MSSSCHSSAWSPEVVSADDPGPAPGPRVPQPGVSQRLGRRQPLWLGPDQQTRDQALALTRDGIKLGHIEVITATVTQR